METHSSILAWNIPWTEEPGKLQSMGSQRVGHDLMTEHAWRVTAPIAWNDEGTIWLLQSTHDYHIPLVRNKPWLFYKNDICYCSTSQAILLIQ